MQIETIKDTELITPSYIPPDIDTFEYVRCLKSAGRQNLQNGGRSSELRYSGVSERQAKLIKTLQEDPEYERYLVSAIRTGQQHLGVTSDLVTILAEMLADREEILEIADQVGSKLIKDSKTGELVWRGDKIWVEGLSKGTIVYRNHVYEVSNLKGEGVAYIEGGAVSIRGGEGGVAYVRGDVDSVSNTQNTMVIIDGKIENYLLGNHPLPDMNIPFVIAVKKDNTHLSNIHPPFLVDREAIRDWSPLEVRQKALDLWKYLMMGRAMQTVDMLRAIENVQGIAAFKRPFTDRLRRTHNIESLPKISMLLNVDTTN